MKITPLVLLLLLSMSFEVSPQERNCSKEEAMQAEDSVGMLSGWDDFYQSFKRFRHCDDGAIAEGYTDSVVRLLSSHWNQLQKLSDLSSSDSKFLDFVLRHINATADQDELKKVLINAQTHCPKSAGTLCSMIEKAVEKAMGDFKILTK